MTARLPMAAAAVTLTGVLFAGDQPLVLGQYAARSIFR